MQTPRTEFAQALKAIATERGLDADVIIDTIKQAIIAAYKRDARDKGEEVEELMYDVELDPVNGEAKIFAWEEGKDEEKQDVTPPGFGRIAAQTAKQVIHQKIREAEKSSIMDEFSGRIGSLVSGIILRFDGPNVRVDLGRTEGIMPSDERTPNERLSPNQRLTFLLKDIVESPRGKDVILSRADPNFVKMLFAREVPEIGSGSVEVRSIAREAGVRTKMTVISSQQGVDPVGSCVGQKGVRVQAVTNELDGERVDIIPWTDDEKELIILALSPAEGLKVRLDKKVKIAKVSAPEDQLSMAIGKDGQNARLAAKLTGWKIEVEPDDIEPKKKSSKEEKVKETKKETKESKTDPKSETASEKIILEAETDAASSGSSSDDTASTQSQDDTLQANTTDEKVDETEKDSDK